MINFDLWSTAHFVLLRKGEILLGMKRTNICKTEERLTEQASRKKSHGSDINIFVTWSNISIPVWSLIIASLKTWEKVYSVAGKNHTNKLHLVEYLLVSFTVYLLPKYTIAYVWGVNLWKSLVQEPFYLKLLISQFML